MFYFVSNYIVSSLTMFVGDGAGVGKGRTVAGKFKYLYINR